MLTLIFSEDSVRGFGYKPVTDDAHLMSRLCGGMVTHDKLAIMKELGYTIIIKGKVDGERTL